MPQGQQPRKYFSARQGGMEISEQSAWDRLRNLYVFYRNKDFFKEKLGATTNHTPDSVEQEAVVRLGFRAFPINKWNRADITFEHIFDTIEFLYDNASKPGPEGEFVSTYRGTFVDYESYDADAGRAEFQAAANLILESCGDGFELSVDGEIRALGVDGLEQILTAAIVPLDSTNVDDRVKAAVNRWRDRHASLKDRKVAIRELADVFEWLKKDGKLSSVLVAADESDLFNIANNFAIRHHNGKQKTHYDEEIWYSWMFHFYLATYHACSRLLKKKRDGKKRDPKVSAQLKP